MNRLLVLLMISVAASCSRGDAPGSDQGPSTDTSVAPGNFRGRIYERDVVFTTLKGDTAFLVPWLITASTRPGGVHRETRGWLVRGGAWDPFYNESWDTPPTRAPWRVLPHGHLRLIVGQGDALMGILFDEGPRQLEIELGDALIEWGGPRGETLRLLDASLYLSNQRVDGMALDLARAHTTDDRPPGDWVFLVSGDSLQVVVMRPEAGVPGTPEGYRGWARLDFRDIRWPTVEVAWTRTQSFPPARRDVPVAWTLTAGEGSLQGELEAGTSQIEAGEGEGPVLPVDALFEVTGTLRIEGLQYPVRGLFRHKRS